jgi:hypothetical protein
MVLVLKSDRKKPVGLVPTPEEKLALYDTMFAYSGTYTVKSDRVIHHLDTLFVGSDYLVGPGRHSPGTQQCVFGQRY